MPNINPAVQRPPNRTYAPPETTCSFAAFYMGISTSGPCTLIVDSTRRIVPPTNNPGLPRSRLLGLRAQNTPVTAIAKATYAIYVMFHRRLPGGSVDHKPQRWSTEGTVVHIGEGLFLTNAHVLRWKQDSLATYSDATHVARIWLRGGSGKLHEKGLPGKSSDLLVETFAWPAELLSGALDQGFHVRGGLMDSRYDPPMPSDFVLLRAVRRSWLARLRQPALPHILPQSATAHQATFPATLVCVNGRGHDIRRYDPAVNSSVDFWTAMDRLLPDVISYATTDLAQKCIVDRDGNQQPAPAGVAPDILKYPIAAIKGSSGGGVYDSSTKRLIGINTSSESDPVPVLPDAVSTNTSPDNLTTAISLTSPAFRRFISKAIIPEFQRIGTPTARQLSTEWSAI
jgi:hypothetical protein